MTGVTRRTGWSAVTLWAIWAAVTTLLAFEFPTAAVVLGLAGLGLARLLRIWPEGAGALGGAGTVCLVIGLLNLGGGQPCASSQAPSCGGVAPVPLIAVGALLVVAAIVLCTAVTRHGSR